MAEAVERIDAGLRVCNGALLKQGAFAVELSAEFDKSQETSDRAERVHLDGSDWEIL